MVTAMRVRGFFTLLGQAALAFLFLLAATGIQKAHGADSAWLAEHYTKYEYRIPMRDGIRLFTHVYVPKDDAQTWPILLTRTPYSLKPYGADNYNDASGSFGAFAKDTFILVSQDVRGRNGSEGEFMEVRPYNPSKGQKDIDESTDAWDTIDWLVKNVPGNNGKVGITGISYPGFYASMGMIDTHPALKAASPQAPITDWFVGDDIHYNGAFLLSQNFGFCFWFDQKIEDPMHEDGRDFHFGTPDGYDFFLRMGPLSNSDTLHLRGRSPSWKEMLRHPNYDAYWQARNIRPHLKNVRCAVLTVGGWYDGEDLFGALETYRWTEKLNPGITNTLVMGPWVHGEWGGGSGESLGPIRFRAKTGDFFREKVELPFFKYYLKGDTNYTPAEALVFETGTDQWRRFDSWPPAQCVTRALYFHPKGTLALEGPVGSADAFDEFPSDPAKPVPYSLDPSTSYSRSYPVEDQRFAASRPDVLVYETDPLPEDLTVAGPLTASLYVSTTGTDADWVVKLVDVYPGAAPNPEPNPAHVKMGGYQRLVRGNVIRGRFRNSLERPEPFEPGKRAKVEFTLPDVLHTFRSGHRVMVQVQSSWFPLVDRNPQTYVDIATAKREDFQKAMHRVYLGGESSSCLKVGVLPARKPPAEPHGE